MLFLANLSFLWPVGDVQSSGDDGETQQLERNALAVETAEYYSTYQLRNISCLLHRANLDAKQNANQKTFYGNTPYLV